MPHRLINTESGLKKVKSGSAAVSQKIAGFLAPPVNNVATKQINHAEQVATINHEPHVAILFVRS